MIPAIVVSSIFLLLIIIYLVAVFFAYRGAYYNDEKGLPISLHALHGVQYKEYRERMDQAIDKAKLIPINEEVRIKSYDGKSLYAKIYISNLERPWVIEVHGYKGIGIRDFWGGLPEMLYRGFNVLLVDQRGHGESEGRTFTFGVKEQYDVDSWIDYLNKRYNNPKMFLYGISMGGNTVVNCVAHNLPMNVLGVIADSPYNRARDVVMYRAKERNYPHFIAVGLLYPAAAIFAHFNLNKGDAAEAVKKTKIPVLIIHGNRDKTSPTFLTEQIYQANPQMVTYFQVPNAVHVMSLLEDHEGTVNAMVNFIEKKMHLRVLPYNNPNEKEP
ncbi:MAG: alpha/beta hydrolase [Bacilli bacterium]|nr:alpha/beta hydrolase [Bacilli bacterium]